MFVRDREALSREDDPDRVPGLECGQRVPSFSLEKLPRGASWVRGATGFMPVVSPGCWRQLGPETRSVSY